MPANPPVRGRSRIIKCKVGKSKKENVFESLLRKRQKTEKASTNTSKQKVLETSVMSDKDFDILENGSLLTDVQMNAANLIMRAQFMHIEGFQDKILGSKLQFDIRRGKFCQI